MDFDLREWLLILGPAFIAAVLVHGYFRMRASQNQLKMKLDKNFLSPPGVAGGVDDLSLLKAELPNGGARVIRKDPPVTVDNADKPAPVLQEPVNALEENDSSLVISADDLPSSAPVTETDELAAGESMLPEVGKAPPAMLTDPIIEEEAEPAATPRETAREESAIPKPEKFVVLNILALDEPFAGQQLLEILVESGMVFGEMDIFHRMGEDGTTCFSLASAVVPGTFDMATIEHFSTPGVTMFMRVHELADPIRVLDDMLDVAETIAQELGGEVCDETRSVMTPQTVEHCRQSVREFQFRHSA